MYQWEKKSTYNLFNFLCTLPSEKKNNLPQAQQIYENVNPSSIRNPPLPNLRFLKSQILLTPAQKTEKWLKNVHKKITHSPHN